MTPASFTLTRLAGLALLLGLAACGTPGHGSDMRYTTANGKAASLDLPPDISQLAGARRDDARGPASISASDYAAGVRDAPAQPPTALTVLGDVRLQSEGRQHWLVVGRTPAQLWAPLRAFWQDNGYLLTTDQPTLGIMETDWLESRARLPQDIVRETISKAMETQHTTGELDRFRTRLERAPDGRTEIFISHRAMREVTSASRARDDTVWKTQPVDPEIEAEFLRRLMARLGRAEGQTSASADTAASPVQTVRLATVGNSAGQPTLELAEGFDLAWRHVGLALDRSGFTVEDRDRSTGTYFVRYVPPDPNRKEPGVIDKVIGFVKPVPVEAPLKLGIVVKSRADASTVSVIDPQGAPVQMANAQRIVDVIAADLR